jgi:hypothetical protein
MDFLRTVNCQALVPACLRYRRVFHSPVVLGQVCLRYLPAYLSLAEYLLFQVFLTLLLGYLASDLVCQRFQVLDPVYLRCQRDFLLAVFLDFPTAVCPYRQVPTVSQHCRQAPMDCQSFLQAPMDCQYSQQAPTVSQYSQQVLMNCLYLQAPTASQHCRQAPMVSQSCRRVLTASQPCLQVLTVCHFQQAPTASQRYRQLLVDFPLEASLDFPIAVFLTAVFQLVVFRVLAQVFQLFQRQRTFFLGLVGSRLVAFQGLVQGCRRVSQACRIPLYHQQQTL